MKPFVFIADLFLEDYSGGAERTTQALIDSCDGEVIKIRSNNLTSDHIEQFKDCQWIVCNFANLSPGNKLEICKNVNYSIVEYDYKFCKHRSLDLHRRLEGSECNCMDRPESKINLAFYGLATKIWFMSITQKNIFLQYVRTVKEESISVLSSVFSAGDLRFIDSLKDNLKDDTYLVVKSNSWLKNFEECVKHAQDNNLKYEAVQNLPYHELLIKLSTSKGLVCLPSGADTCPRLVIEAKMLGCKLVLNELVQHKDEEWFDTSRSCREHMNSRREEFWNFYE